MSSNKEIKFTVVSDVPVPPVRHPSTPHKMLNALKDLQVNQAVLVSIKERDRLYGRQSQIKDMFPTRKYAVRTIPEKQQAGIWRVR